MNRVLPDNSKASIVRKNPCQKPTMNKLYEQRHETGDIKFIVGSEEIPAHRCVLAALSPKYKAQFYGAMAQNDVVNVNGVSPAAFKEFLQFFYTDEVTLTLEHIEDVLNLAKQSLVDELEAECIDFLFDAIGMDKLVWFYRLARQYQIESLDEFCIKRISAHIKSVFKTMDFLNCDQEMLCHILDFDSMNCNEADVFDACISWARVKCEHEQIDGTKTANLRAVLGDAIFKIRWCSMTADRFTNVAGNYSGLLSGSELNEVCRVITLKAIGEVSSTFGVINGNPRQFMRQPTLKCSFIKGSPIKFNIAIQSDYMIFSCDKAINLSGFVICNRIDQDIRVEVDISGVPQSLNFIKSISGQETKIIFDNPIHLGANKWCRIDIAWNTPIAGFQGFNIEGSILQNGVLFKFDHQLCTMRNSIIRFLFETSD